MTEPTGRQVPAPLRPRSRLRGLLTQIAPRWFVAPVPRLPSEAPPARADASRVPATPAQAAPDTQALVVAHDRLRLRSALRLVAFTASAVAVAAWFRSFYGGPMLPTPVFAFGSIAWLAAGAFAHLVERRQTPSAGAAAERRGPRVKYVMTWIGLLWACLALF